MNTTDSSKWSTLRAQVENLGFVDGSNIIKAICTTLPPNRRQAVPLGFVVHMFLPGMIHVLRRKIYLHVADKGIGRELLESIGTAHNLFGQMHELSIQGELSFVRNGKLSEKCVEYLLHTFVQECLFGDETFSEIAREVMDVLSKRQTNVDVIAYFGTMYVTTSYDKLLGSLQINADESENASLYRCDVCFESIAQTLCSFKCPHGFCLLCTRNFKIKGINTCPKCRAPRKDRAADIDLFRTFLLDGLLVPCVVKFATKICVWYLTSKEPDAMKECSEGDDLKFPEEVVLNACAMFQKKHLGIMRNYRPIIRRKIEATDFLMKQRAKLEQK